MEAPERILAPLADSVNPLELTNVALGSSEVRCGAILTVTVSLTAAVFDPPPDAVNWFTNSAGALMSTLAVWKIGG